MKKCMGGGVIIVKYFKLGLGDSEQNLGVISVKSHVRLGLNPANIQLFKVNNRNTRKRCEICSKLTIKTPERR